MTRHTIDTRGDRGRGDHDTALPISSHRTRLPGAPMHRRAGLPTPDTPAAVAVICDFVDETCARDNRSKRLPVYWSGRHRALRLLSRPRFRPSRGRAGVSLGLDGCEVRLCDPCARVRPCVPCVSRVRPGSPRCLFTASKRSFVRFALSRRTGRTGGANLQSFCALTRAQGIDLERLRT